MKEKEGLGKGVKKRKEEKEEKGRKKREGEVVVGCLGEGGVRGKKGEW